MIKSATLRLLPLSIQFKGKAKFLGPILVFQQDPSRWFAVQAREKSPSLSSSAVENLTGLFKIHH
ncbi:unnamed protein product [Brassica rapa]|uniref:Uncharacterized protein n=1 Tax=Brassica campestris TaxID=3711 RepID=A0A3P6BIY7_BRACM|nr:unnamed protein product [Brassica rapa]VDC95968.1 unnamed protein product [Brassica rapa]